MQNNHQEQLETSHVPQETGFSFLLWNYGVCQRYTFNSRGLLKHYFKMH